MTRIRPANASSTNCLCSIGERRTARRNDIRIEHAIMPTTSTVIQRISRQKPQRFNSPRMVTALSPGCLRDVEVVRFTMGVYRIRKTLLDGEKYEQRRGLV